MTWLMGIFGNIKNTVIAAFAIFGGLYVAKLKYDAYSAEDKLKTIENKIAKTNVMIAKTKAKAKAKAKKIETDTEVEVLRELKKEAKVIEKEMQTIEKEVQKRLHTKGSKVSSTRRRRGKKIKVEV